MISNLRRYVRAARGLRAMLLATAVFARVPAAIASTAGQEDPDGQPMTPVELGIPQACRRKWPRTWLPSASWPSDESSRSTR
jgi:hypothetical protein